MNLWNKYVWPSSSSSRSKLNENNQKHSSSLNKESIKSPSSSSLISDQQEALYQLNESFQRENRSSFSIFGTSNTEKQQNKKANSILNQLSGNSSSINMIRNQYSQLHHSDFISPERTPKNDRLTQLDSSSKLRVDVFEDSESDGETLDEERQNSFTTFNTSLDESLSLDLNLINTNTGVNHSHNHVNNNIKTTTSAQSIPQHSLSSPIKQPQHKVRKTTSTAPPPPAPPAPSDLQNTNSVLINRNEFDLLLRKKLKDCQKKQLQQQLRSQSSSLLAAGYQVLTVTSPPISSTPSPPITITTTTADVAVGTDLGQSTAVNMPFSPWQSSLPPVSRLNEKKTIGNHLNPSIISKEEEGVQCEKEEDTNRVFFCPEGINRSPFTPIPSPITICSNNKIGSSGLLPSVFSSPTSNKSPQKSTRSFSFFSNRTYQQTLLTSPINHHRYNRAHPCPLQSPTKINHNQNSSSNCNNVGHYSYRSPSSSSSFYSQHPLSRQQQQQNQQEGVPVAAGERRVLKRSLAQCREGGPLSLSSPSSSPPHQQMTMISSCEYSPTPANSPKDNSSSSSYYCNHQQQTEDGPLLKTPKK